MRIGMLGGMLALAAATGPARADDPSGGSPDAAGPDADLSGEDIYERVVANRFRSYEKDLTLLSRDRGGSAQETQLTITWANFREIDGERDGVLSKTRVVYTAPWEVRFTSYLIINHLERPNDQFVYLASRRRVRRVNLRGENLFGTDFSFEDVVPRELEDASYRRLPDQRVQDGPAFAVEAIPDRHTKSEYSRIVFYVEKEHFVPIETHYWDEAGVEVKRLRAERESIRDFDGVWLPLRARMRHLLHDSETRLRVDRVVPNPDITRRVFDIRSLESH